MTELKRMGPWLSIVAALAVVLAPGLAAAQESTLDVVKKRGTLIAGVRGDLYPLGFTNSKGELDGFDLEIDKLFAEKLGVKLETRTITSATMIPALQTGTVDIGPTATPSKRREESIDFSIVAFWDKGVVLVRKDSPVHSLKDLEDKTFAIAQGSIYGTMMKEMFPKAKFLTFEEWTQIVTAVETGKADATPATLSFTQILSSRPNSNLRVVEEDFGRDPLAFLVRENDSKWRKWINWTLQELWKSGKIQELHRKYLGFEPQTPMWSAFGLQPGLR
jgi:polar amino acid transport system substrate-binding protein